MTVILRILKGLYSYSLNKWPKEVQISFLERIFKKCIEFFDDNGKGKVEIKKAHGDGNNKMNNDKDKNLFSSQMEKKGYSKEFQIGFLSGVEIGLKGTFVSDVPLTSQQVINNTRRQVNNLEKSYSAVRENYLNERIVGVDKVSKICDANLENLSKFKVSLLEIKILDKEKPE